MFFLYRHIRLDKNIPFYIGIGREYYHSTNPYKRAFVKAKRNPIWNSIVNKTDYEVEILFETEKESVIKIKESEFIRLYGRVDLKSGTLANMSDGGDGAFNMSNITKNKLSKLMEGNKINIGRPPSEYSRLLTSKRLKGNTIWRGRTHKEESKQKISIARIGKPLSMEHRNNLIGTRPHAKKVSCKNNGVVYNSICECIRLLFKCNLPSNDNVFRNYKNYISFVCNGKRDNYKGYKFKFV